MGTYSFVDVTASMVGPAGVIDLGYGAGNADEGIKVVMTANKNTVTVGAGGEVMHSLSPASYGTVTVTLMKTSPVNKKLSLAYNAQSQSSSLWGKNVIVIRNSASGDVITAHQCAFQKQPDYANGKEGGTVAWVFDAGKIDQLLGEY
ncbi:phage structural protein [Atlantibacter subterraneus]|uniref:Phage protein n=1 Tax=Atlantibacter subterraneus TaxID=255519 RepID=A0ABU4E536_9ENTR|nr:phage protein [Atlantibacter subterranea]MDV7023801.1 phage protein [Atlantibacter subterranea]MDW2744566.1 phage protein [Atlantibacter subterranea]MDZ5666897.1 phage protein [Atlantibacter hermannii]UTJ45711.1 DUF3277 family protein [Atlantibacter subterranea]